MATFGDDSFTQAAESQSLTFIQPPPTITIAGDDGPLVTIHPDGHLEYGPGYDPDEAARRFWDALQRYMPARCERCGHVPHHEL